jgi:hypothetical protein
MTTTAKRSTRANGSRSSSTTSDLEAAAAHAASQRGTAPIAQLATPPGARETPRRLPLTPDETGCRVFSASQAQTRELLGGQVTSFIADLRRAGGHVTDYKVTQSSDDGWHCLSIVVFYVVPAGGFRAASSR